MSHTTDFGINDDLIFFGKVNASISHELKNNMAIISEAAGLLQDLTDLAVKGEKLELEMLKTCSEDIIEEIQRGFAIIRQMNTFSHSVDDPVKKVNLSNIIDLMVAISKFLSFASKIRFNPIPEDAPVVLTCPFRLQHLIYRALVFAFESAGPDGQIVIDLQPQPDGSVYITFSGQGSSKSRTFASEKTKMIAASIGIEIQETADSHSFGLAVPESFKVAQQP